MIKTLSPYYVNVPFVDPTTSITCTNYTLRIYVWNGNKDTAPSEPSYIMTKSNPTNSTASDKVNIARLINDYINFAPKQRNGTGLLDADNQLWCKTTIAYDGGSEQLSTTQLCVKGYNYGMSGENGQTPTNKILLQGSEFKVSRESIFVLPIMIEEPITVLPFANIFDVKILVETPELSNVFWTYPRPYTASSVTLQISTDNGQTWINNTGSATSPRTISTPPAGAWFRLKSLEELETYSNIYVW